MSMPVTVNALVAAGLLAAGVAIPRPLPPTVLRLDGALVGLAY